MPTEIDWEIRIDAEDMYITGGMTYEQVAEKTGVALSTIKRWGSEGGWTERKRELREAERDIKQKTVMLRLGLIQTAMDGHDPMQVFAAAKFEDLALKKEAIKGLKGISEATSTLEAFKTPQEAVLALQSAIERKIGMMVSGNASLDLKTLKDLKAAMELLDGMKAKNNTELKETKGKGLSDEAAEEIRKKILGISE